MIFTRRYVQSCLSGLSGLISDKALNVLAAKLNTANEARLPAMWEVVILHALSALGRVDYEKELPSGRTPDIAFSKRCVVSFTADITTISDSGLAEANPIDRLSKEIEACKRRLGLPIGGVTLEVGSERTKTNKGPRTSLLLPAQKDIQRFVKDRIEPVLRAKIKSGEPLALAIDEPGVRISLKITSSRYTSISHAAYDAPEALTRNPLYNALDSKKKQLRTSTGLTGIIVCDGDSRALSRHLQDRHTFTPQQILTEFLRQNSSIDFVLVISVDEKHSSWPYNVTERWMTYILRTQPSLPAQDALDGLFQSMAEKIGPPKRSATNAAHQARAPGYGWGHHGGLEMSGSRIRLSSRLVMEVLSGRRSAEEMNQLQGWRSVTAPPDNQTMFNPFDKWLEDGRLPASVAIDPDAEHDDDWIEFTASARDAAVSDFVVPAQANWFTAMGRRVSRLIWR